MYMHLCNGLVGEDNAPLVAFQWAFRDDHKLIPQEGLLLIPVKMGLILTDADTSGLVGLLEVLSTGVEDLLSVSAIESI